MPDSEVELEVRAVIDGITEALQAADAKKLDALLSDRPGSTHIGSDPREWLTKDQLLAGISEAMSVGEVQVGVEIGDVAVHVLGDVAWAEGTGKFTNGQGEERAVRTTGVFVREGGGWRSVQSHASIGVRNEEMFNT
jgi:ketosteroid isomerase-like protein